MLTQFSLPSPPDATPAAIACASASASANAARNATIFCRGRGSAQYGS